jgi:hypothetical protein
LQKGKHKASSRPSQQARSTTATATREQAKPPFTMKTKKTIVFIDILLPYRLGPRHILEATKARTSTVIKLAAYQERFEERDLISEKSQEHKYKAAAFDKIFAAAHTIVLPDSMFITGSMYFETEGFLYHGIRPLVDFYKNGGNIIVFCSEGTRSIGDDLNPLFGTDWKFAFAKPEVVEATARGRDLLGNVDSDSSFFDSKLSFLTCPKHEVLFRPQPTSKLEFIEENFSEKYYSEGLEHEYDAEIEKAWERYVETSTSIGNVCLHKGPNGGNIMFYSDRGQEGFMRPVFCKFLDLHTCLANADPVGSLATDESTLNTGSTAAKHTLKAAPSATTSPVFPTTTASPTARVNITAPGLSLAGVTVNEKVPVKLVASSDGVDTTISVSLTAVPNTGATNTQPEYVIDITVVPKAK